MDPVTLIALLSAAGIGGSLLKGGIELWSQHTLGKKQLGLQTALATNETTAARLSNEENRRQAEQFMAMFREEKSEARRSKAEDRQMQLLQVLLASTLAGRQQAGQAAIGAQRQMPPMALTTLLRGE
jgi:hypothetical protein